MKRQLLVLLITSVLLIGLILPANAGLVPEVSGSYTITTTPAVDSSDGAIHVAPGQTITLDATATVNYVGSSASGVKVTANVYAYLYQGGVQKTESDKSFSRTLDLVSNNTYTVSDSMTLTVPADAAAGDYLLKIVATASADYLGMTYNEKPVTEKYVVKVISPTASGTPTETPVTTPTPVPSSFHLNSSSLVAGDNGTATFSTGDVTGNTDTGTGSGSVDVNLTHTTDANINVTIKSDPDPAANTQFMLTAAENGNDISNIAYVMVVDHPTLTNGNDIGGATITMKVSKAWVEANGGVDAVRIYRYSDGVSEALNTTCLNPGGDPMIFQAYSPHGLSEFALVSVAQLPVTAAETAVSGVQVGSSIIIGVIAVIAIVLIAIVGVVYMLKQRGKKGKKE